MRALVRLGSVGALAVTLVCATWGLGFASCLDDDPDGSKVAAARLTAEQNCAALGAGCANAQSHGKYVSCIAHQAKTLSTGDGATLPKSCKGQVKSCAARSACGKQAKGFATCCLTDAGGDVSCKTRQTDNCTNGGGVVGTCGSCCDACNGGTGPTCPAAPTPVATP
jgi:hypothetical protein